jgi:hypothetical protein
MLQVTIELPKENGKRKFRAQWFICLKEYSINSSCSKTVQEMQQRWNKLDIADTKRTDYYLIDVL